MNIVIDTNILVAGLLSPFGPCGRIIRMVLSGELRPCYDTRILAEYRAVLSRLKFKFDTNDVESLINFIQNTGLLVNAKSINFDYPDPDDTAFLEVAVTAQTKFLVTGNLKHFPSDFYQNVQILSPSNFFNIIIQNS
jgi:uncharacterized protein